MEEQCEQELIIEKEILVAAHPKQLFRFWRNFENAPQIFDFLENALVLDSKRATWSARLGGSELVIWDIEIVEEIENTLLRWHSGQNPELLHEGMVRFVGMGDGKTQIRLQLRFFLPIQEDMKPDLLGPDLDGRIEEDLRRFKLAVEAGEFPRPRESKAGTPESFVEAAPKKRFEPR